MRISRVLLAALALSTLGSTAALADTFSFSFGTTSNKFSGSGVLTGTLTAPGVYTITDVTGTTTINGTNVQDIAGVETAGTFQGNDNLLKVSQAGVGTFDLFGLSYLLDNSAQVNLYTNLGGDQEVLERVNGNDVTESVNYTVTRSVATTPEPGSFLLLGTGLVGGIGAMRRRLFA